MRVIQSASGASHAVELQAVIEAERAQLPFLVARDDQDRQRLFVLEPKDERLWVGRGSACEVCIGWDQSASRCHAELVRVPDGWAVVDDGLSRNGTFVCGQRIAGRRRLHDGEVLRVGNSALIYRLPGTSGASTKGAKSMVALPDLTPAQRRVLVSLCRPLWHAPAATVPATNPAIAAELVLSVPAVKTHIRALFAKFAVEDLPQNQKRVRLAELAMEADLVSQHDL